ncbi:MAG: response regulator transcription factor [Candidatus Pacebacteria bacterium]|nr:response regulator transcription factor [Candidatus Paceibacterota bacterium]MCF7857690.1 response regulator transcription factor [Candidatus Paceibacterota bacterium]
MRILLIEDNTKLVKYIAQAFTEDGYAIDAVGDGETGERMIRMDTYDVVILDIMLPQKDGVAVCQSVRADDIAVPIILLTAKGEVEDRIIGLDSGADDYLMKPFAIEELLARVRALLRRPQSHLHEVLLIQDISLNTATHEVHQSERLINLTLKEYSVLEYLMRNADTVVTREALINHCWDFAYNAFSNITDVYIKQLRSKLNDTNETYIKTVRGVGYTFKVG